MVYILKKLKNLLKKNNFQHNYIFQLILQIKNYIINSIEVHIKNAWEKLNETLELLPKLKDKTRTVFRMNLVKDLNMFPEQAKEYAELIKKSQPLFIEIKGFMSCWICKRKIRI